MIRASVFAPLLVAVLMLPAKHLLAETGLPAFYTLTDLAIECEAKTIACDAYVAAIVDMNVVYGADSKAWNAICIGNDVSIDDLGSVITDYAKDREDLLGAPAAFHVTIALRSVYPCEQ